nr:unnamed protein product [Callosobruchus analis]
MAVKEECILKFGIGIGLTAVAALVYTTSYRPSLEYCSHVRGCAPKHSLRLLNSIQNRAIILIDAPNLTKDLHSLEEG